MCSDYLTFKLHCSVITVAVKFRVGQKPLKFKVTSEANCSRVNFSSNFKSSLSSSFHDFAQSLLCRWHIWHYCTLRWQNYKPSHARGCDITYLLVSYTDPSYVCIIHYTASDNVYVSWSENETTVCGHGLMWSINFACSLILTTL